MITIAILTKDSEDTIKKTLESTKDFNEVIILDTGSKDRTLDIAKTYKNTKIFKEDFTSFGELRNKAAKLSSNDWILALDSDEEISINLLKEIKDLKLDPSYIYNIPFHNYYNKKLIKCCGWYPEYHIRLYNRKKTQFDTALVHEGLIKKGLKIRKLKNPINHYSYRSLDDFLKKMQIYTSLFAKQNKGKKSSFTKALIHGFFAFFKCYFLKKGFLNGKEGFIISSYNANTAFYKYLKLDEINRI